MIIGKLIMNKLILTILSLSIFTVYSKNLDTCSRVRVFFNFEEEKPQAELIKIKFEYKGSNARQIKFLEINTKSDSIYLKFYFIDSLKPIYLVKAKPELNFKKRKLVSKLVLYINQDFNKNLPIVVKKYPHFFNKNNIFNSPVVNFIPNFEQTDTVIVIKGDKVNKEVIQKFIEKLFSKELLSNKSIINTASTTNIQIIDSLKGSNRENIVKGYLDPVILFKQEYQNSKGVQQDVIKKSLP